MSDVKPALSSAEWVRAWTSSPPATTTAARILDDRGDVGAPGTPERINAYQKVLAALALHGQPYGFTWEDVDMLIMAASRWAGLDEEDDAQDLADRIAALLPPREEP